MLVLTRRPGEQIVIGEGIRVTVVSLGPGRVKIGIEAPAHVRVDRQEIHAKIAQEQAPQAVTAEKPADEPTPIVVPSLDAETPKLHNRIADRLPTPVAEAPLNRLSKHRLPRKSR